MNKKLLTVLSLSFVFLFTVSVYTLYFNNGVIVGSNAIYEKSVNDFENELNSSDYTPDLNGIGENLNVTLHQSLLNSSDIEFTNLDISHTFIEPVPWFDGYNTSYLNITVDAINAPNKTINLELGTSQSDIIFTDLLACSFTVKQNCILKNFSLYLSESGGSGGNADVKIFIYNATFQNSQIEPDQDTGLVDITQTIINEDSGKWYNYSVEKSLDASETYNNTFFIFFYQDTNPAFARAYYHYETDSNGDNSMTYYNSGSGWQTFTTDRDFSSQVIVGLSDNTPKPTDINLKINGTWVNDDLSGGNFGYWTPSQVYSSSTGKLDFSLTADWWDVSCNVSNVQINYTKTDIKADSDFIIPESAQNVIWNVSISEGLNYFDSRISAFNTINFTIPGTWQDSTTKVFNGTSENANLVKRLLGNGYREIQVLSAGNGTNWYLTANSTNLLSSIDPYVNEINTNVANYSDTMDFNATFSKLIYNGIINLSIYNPQVIGNELNYSREITTFTPSNEIDLGNWDIPNNVTQYGSFRVVVFWSNDTAAGFLELPITVLGETELTLVQPTQNSVFDSDDIFNITIDFNDSGQNIGIENAIIQYRISGGIWTSNNITDLGEGIYNITINCSESIFDTYGDFYIEINSSMSFYNNQSDVLNFKIYGLTDSQIDSPLQDQTYDSDEILTITLSYDDAVKSVPIDSADIQWKIGSTGSFSSTNVSYVGGNYQVELWLRYSEFDGYGPFTLYFTLNKTYYYNQTESLNINILGLTDSQIDSPLQDQTYDSDEILTITLSYDDLIKSIPIDSAEVQWKVGSTGSYSSTNVSYVSGNYQIEIWLRYSEFDGYGPFTLYFTLNKTNYYNQTQQLDFNIIGLTETQIDSPTQDQTFDSDDVMTIILSFDDSVKNIPIDSANVQWKVGLMGTYSSTNVSYVSGNYQIELWLMYSEFDGYGPFTLYFMLNKTNYYNQTSSLNINILGVSSAQIDSPAQDQTYDSDEIVTITLSFDDSIKGLPIDSAEIQWKIGLTGSYSSSNVSYVSGNYEIELWLQYSEFDGYGPFTLYFMLNKTYYYNQSLQLDFTILGLTTSQIDSPTQDQTYDSDEIITIVVSFDDSVKGLPIDSAEIQWKVGLTGSYSSTNVSYASGNYQIEIWLRYSEFDGYGPFTLYFTLNKTNYYNQTQQLDVNILGLTEAQIDSPTQDQTFDSDDVMTVILSFDDSVRSLPIDSAEIQWKVGLTGSYSSMNVSYVSENYQIELWLRYSEFDGYGLFTLYFKLNKTNYYNQTTSLNINVLGVSTSQIDSPAQDETFDSDEIMMITLSFDDLVKVLPIVSADVQWKVGLTGSYSSTNVSYASGNYQIELWLRYSEFDGYGPFTLYFMLNKTNFYNQTQQLDFYILALTEAQIDTPAQDQTYDSDEILTISLSFDDSVKSLPIDSANVQWKIGLTGSYSSTNVSYVSGNYQVELWLRYSEFDGYGLFTLYFMLNKTNYYNQSLQLDFTILGLSAYQLDSPAQDQTYDSNEIITIILSFDDSVKGLPIDSANVQWKVGLTGSYSTTNVSYVSGNYQIELWLRYSEFDSYGPFILYFILNKTNYYNQTGSLNLNILGVSTSQIDSPAQDQTYDSDEIITIIVSFDDSVKGLPIDSANVQWKVGLTGSYSSTNVSYASGNYQIELWLRYSEFDGYGPFTLYFMLNKTNYYNQTQQLDFHILGLTEAQIDSPVQDQTYDSDEIMMITLSFDDSVKNLPIDSASIQWKVGLTGSYSTTNVSYVSGNYQIELWLTYSEFDGYGPFTLYFMLNKTNYYNQSLQLDFTVLGLSTYQLDSPAQDQTYDSDEILTIFLSFDDSVKGLPIDSANVQWKVGLTGSYSSTNVSYASGNYQIELWLRYSEFDGYGSFTLYFMLNKTNYYNQTGTLNINVLGLTSSQIDSPSQDQTYDSDEIMMITLSFDDSIKGLPIDSANVQWKVGLAGSYSTTNVSYVSGNYHIEIWLRYSEFDGYGPFTLYFMLNKTNYYNQTLQLDFHILGLTESQIDSPSQDQNYDSDEIMMITLSLDDSVKGLPIDSANVQWKIGLAGSYSSTNVSYVSGNYQIELWLMYSEFDGYGPFKLYFMLNKTNYYNQSLQLDFHILGLTESQIDSPSQDQTYDSDEILTITLSFDDSIKSLPIDSANVQWKIGLAGSYSSTNVSYVSGNYQVELWLRYSEFDGYGPFTLYFMLNKTNYYNQTNSLNINILGLTNSQIDSPAQDQTYDSNETLIISLSFDDSVKELPIDSANVQWKVGLAGTYSSTNMSYVSGNYQIEIWFRHSYFDGYGPFTLYFMLNKTNYYNQTMELNFNILGLTTYNIINLTQYSQDLQINNSVYEAFQGENITLYMNFINLYPYSLISGAIGNLTFNSVDYLNYSDINGLYSWEIDTNHLLPGSYSFSVQFNKTNYYNQSLTFDFDINIISTEINIESIFDASGTLDPYYDNGYAIYTSKGDSNVTFIIAYWDVNHTYPIGAANGNVSVQGKEFLSNTTLSNGHAWFTLSSSTYEQANFIINVTFWKANYYQYTLWFNLSIVKYETNSSLLAVQQTGGLIDSVYNGTHYILYRNYNTTVLAEYWNEDDNVPIDNAVVSFTLKLGLSTVYFYSDSTNASGQFEFYIPTQDYLTGNYEFTIIFSKEDYKTSTIYGNMSIVLIPTNGSLLSVMQINHISGIPENLTYYSSNNTFVGLLSYDTTIQFTFWDKLNEEWINSGANCILLFDGVYFYNTSTVSNGIYSWIIPTLDKEGTFLIKIEMTKFNWANVSYEFNLTINPIPASSQIDSPTQNQTYDSDAAIIIILSFDDTLRGTPITGANIQWKVGISGSYSNLNVSYVSGNYQIELWLRYSEFDGYGAFTLYFILNKTYYYNQTQQLDINILGLTESQIDSPAQDETFDSEEVVTIILSFDDSIKDVPIDNTNIQWKVGLAGTYSSNNVSYVSGNYQIELWLRYSEFDGYGPFTLYFMLNKTNYYNQTSSLNINILGVSSAQIDSPAQNQTYDSDGIIIIILSYDDSLKGVSITSANIQWRVGISGSYSSVNVSYVSGNYQIELWLRSSDFSGYGPFSLFFMLNKTYYYNQTQQLDINILGLTESQIDSPSQDQTYDSDEILTITLSYDDSLKGTSITSANIQWRVGLSGSYSSVNVSYISGNYQIELWLRYSEFDGYGAFTLYFMLNKTYYYNQTQQLDINILGLTESQIDSPSQDQTFYSNETLLIELSFDDSLKGTPIDSAIIQWKVGLTGSYSSTNVSYISGNYQIELWFSHSLFDGYGPFTLYFMLNKTNYYNQTESLYFNLIGLTSINIINITQYNQAISLNGSVYEAQAGDNMTIYANFLSDYPYKIVTGAIGILTFNGVNYTSLGNIDGLYEWEINTISLPFGLYNFNITFSKTNYENSTTVNNFRINNLIAKIRSIEKPVSVKQGASFYLCLELYYELYEEISINNANLSITINFGSSISSQYAFTNASGMVNYQISVPRNALQIIITVYYSGNGTYTSASFEINDIDLIPVREPDNFPFLPILLIASVVSIGAILSGVLLIKRRSKKKKLLIKEAIPEKEKTTKEVKGKTAEQKKSKTGKKVKETSDQPKSSQNIEDKKEGEAKQMAEKDSEKKEDIPPKSTTTKKESNAVKDKKNKNAK